MTHFVLFPLESFLQQVPDESGIAAAAGNLLDMRVEDSPGDDNPLINTKHAPKNLKSIKTTMTKKVFCNPCLRRSMFQK